MSSRYTYKVWKKILSKKLTLESIMYELSISKLTTRSGIDFVSGLAAIDYNIQPKYIICNAEEGEPGTFKDRDLLLNFPERILEGMAILGFIINANVGYLYIKYEFTEAFDLITQAIKNAYIEGIFGKNLLNSEFNLDIYPLHGAGRYIAGEASAMLESIEGKKAFPRIKPPWPQKVGLYGSPTVVINVETLVNISQIIEKGGDWYFKLSKTKLAGGNKIFSISGHITNPGNYEVPLGIRFTDLLKMAGGVANGKKLKAVLPGGLSSPILPADLISTLTLDYGSLDKAGSTLGSGGIIIMDETTCMVEVLARITRFFMEESCGQCTPCREGTSWLYKVIERISKGNGLLKDLKILDQIAEGIYGKNICPLGDSAALSVKSFLKYFKEEFVKKLKIGSKAYDQV